MATQTVTPTPRVLILGHSFIRRLQKFMEHHIGYLDLSLQITATADKAWHGIGGRTVAKTVKFNSLSSANYFNVFCHVTLKNHISGVIYSSISSYTSLEREKNTLSKKKYFGRRKPIIFRHQKIKKHILHKNFLKFLKTVI